MLVLTRKVNEAIVITTPVCQSCGRTGPHQIEVTVVRTGTHTRLGITAPPNVDVHRSELLWKHEAGNPATKTSENNHRK